MQKYKKLYLEDVNKTKLLEYIVQENAISVFVSASKFLF